MVEVLSKDELKELKELSDRVPSVQYMDAVVKVLRKLEDKGIYGSQAYTGTDMLMEVGRDLLKELRNELEGAHH